MTIATPKDVSSVASDRNKLRSEDRAVHDWYRFVLSFPPHLVRDYLERLRIGPSNTVLDPFCGTGTTLVECKKLGIASVGIESNPMAHLASQVKVDWSVDASTLLEYAEEVAASTQEILDRDGSNEWVGLPLLTTNGNTQSPMRQLGLEQSKLLLKDSISLIPLHKSLVLLDEIDRHGDTNLRQYGRLALAKALAHRIGNLKFGPEVGLGRIKDDAPVVEAWLEGVREIVRDVRHLSGQSHVPAQVLKS